MNQIRMRILRHVKTLLLLAAIFTLSIPVSSVGAMRPLDAPIADGIVIEVNDSAIEQLPKVKMPKRKKIAKPDFPKKEEIQRAKGKLEGDIRILDETPDSEILYPGTPE